MDQCQAPQTRPASDVLERTNLRTTAARKPSPKEQWVDDSVDEGRAHPWVVTPGPNGEYRDGRDNNGNDPAHASLLHLRPSGLR